MIGGDPRMSAGKLFYPLRQAKDDGGLDQDGKSEVGEEGMEGRDI